MSEDKIKIERKKMLCNKIKIPGDISSQFITALLFICPLLTCKDKDFIEIELTTPLVSIPYIKITLDVLNTFGINIQEDLEGGKFYITIEQNYRAQSYEIPGDFSSSAFIIAATILSSKPTKVVINNLSMKNYQGDKKIIEILNENCCHGLLQGYNQTGRDGVYITYEAFAPITAGLIKSLRFIGTIIILCSGTKKSAVP